MSYFILSMPGARSDWFARLVAGVTELRYREQDYLNPLTCPVEHREKLEGVFPGPALSLIEPLVNPDYPAQQRALSLTWEAQLGRIESYELDKETWALTAMPALIAQGHNVMMLTRDRDLLEHAGPAIIAQYDLVWWVLKQHGKLHRSSSSETRSTHSRARVAHRWWINEAIRLCEEHRVHRVTLESLLGMHPARLVSALVCLREWLPGLDISALAEIVASTREMLLLTEKNRSV